MERGKYNLAIGRPLTGTLYRLRLFLVQVRLKSSKE